MCVTSPPLNDKQKAWLRRSNGIKTPWSVDAPVTAEVVRAREFNAPTSFKGFKARRGRCVLSHEKRLLILEKTARRVEFFASLGVVV